MNVSSQVARQLQEIREPSAIKRMAEAAIIRVLDGTKMERFAMMELAVPAMSQGTTAIDLPELDKTLYRRFEEYFIEKNLNPDVLLTGAIMLELGDAQLSADRPTAGKLSS